MKAIVYETYGGPDVLKLREVAKPEPKQNGVLIRTHATVATPSDSAMRSGKPFAIRFFSGLTKPKARIIGDAMAGEIEAIGAAVTLFKVGDRIVASSDMGLGAYAEYKCLAETGSMALMPDNISFAEAVAIGEGMLTALPFLRDTAQLKAGQKILINGASGNVGSTAVQLAKYFGAQVTGVCGPKHVDLVRALGAGTVIDYTKEDFTKAGETYDVIFDAVGKSSFGRCKAALTPQGLYLTTVPDLPAMLQMLLTSKSTGKRAMFVATGLRTPPQKVEVLKFLKPLAEAGHVRAVIDRTYPLADMSAAHTYVDMGHKTGSVVIDITGGLA